MNKYINTDDIEYITWSLYNGHDMRGNTLFIERDIVSKQIIDAMPAADVVDVVRCKDCKHNLSNICYHDFAMNVIWDDSFCSYGERREDDER